MSEQTEKTANYENYNNYKTKTLRIPDPTFNALSKLAKHRYNDLCQYINQVLFEHVENKKKEGEIK